MEPWSFIHVTDIHVGSPKSFRFKPACNENWQTAREQIVSLAPDLLLVGGDLGRDGTLHSYELEAVKADLDDLPFPYHVVPGNMDTGNKHTDVQSPRDDRDDVALNLTSEDLRHWEAIFGPPDWSFIHKNVRFCGLCDMILGSGLPEEELLWAWLEAYPLLRMGFPKETQYQVWLMHSALFVDDLHEPNWDITDEEDYHDWYFALDEPQRSRLMDIFRATGTDLVLSGHVHCRKTHFAEGIRFDIGPSTAFGQWGDRWEDGDDTLGFLRYEVSDSGLECGFVPLAQVSERSDGYGPGGHPLPHLRDYSIAWEPGGEPAG